MRLLTERDQPHAELYAHLSGARLRFALAARATADTYHADEDGIEAGCAIFQSTYQALSFYKWEKRVPFLDELPEAEQSEMVLPFPVLVALDYFLDSEQSVCLSSWKLRSGNPDIDRAVLSWPNTILWGLPAKMRFFYDLIEAYGGTPTEAPLLSNSRTRAVQLLIIGREILERQLKKIGKPHQGEIFLTA